MNSSGKFGYSLRRYPLLRVAVAVIFISIILSSIYLISNNTKPVPVIESITPSVGSPGDVVLITGKNFGDTRDMNYVEFAGSKLTASSYISWADDSIKLVLPANVKDGLVYVGIKEMRSNPALFANEINIPIPVPSVTQNSKPVITSLSSEKLSVGDVLVIKGNNFGDTKNLSKVMFTIDYNDKIHDSNVKNLSYYTENMIQANDDDFDYISWSNTEISVVVPDGASSGVVVVASGHETSEPKEITISETLGRKSYKNKKIYLMSYSADIADVVCDGVATITLRAPIPAQCASQPDVEVTEVNPVPALSNYQHNIIHQVTKNKSSSIKNEFNHTFVLPVYEINSKVNIERILPFKYLGRAFYKNNISATELFPCNDKDVIELCNKIVGKEKNNYKKVRLIYNYMLENFRLLKNLKKDTGKSLELLSRKSGDAYDFSVMFTTLVRAAKIPCLTDCGILISQDLSTQPHWWNEFYIEGFGWIPVDVALGSGLEYKDWSDIEGDVKDYYFGNLDSHHVVFSRGLNDLKPFSMDNKIMQQQKSFALQNIWEEASSNVSKYSSYWGNPVIKGVY